jgi:cell division septation protein DedD
VAQHTQDEGFHEIQLNGKQLVFLFMAATVVSVVIFLCGVLVGRGVRSQVATIDTSAPSTVTEIAPAPSPASAPAPAAGSDPTKAAPPAGDDLSYFKRLETQNPPAEQLKPASDRKPAPERSARAEAAVEPPTPAPKPAPAPVRERTPPPAAEKAPAPEKARAAAPVPAPEPAAPAASAPPGQGFAVQIAALNVRSEADAIAKRLNSKGYAAYVLTPANGTPSVFRVRVGTFTTRREAESIAAKLQKEEQFKPWVTR